MTNLILAVVLALAAAGQTWKARTSAAHHRDRAAAATAALESDMAGRAAVPAAARFLAADASAALADGDAAAAAGDYAGAARRYLDARLALAAAAAALAGR